MLSRSPAEAVEDYRRTLQRIISCITRGVLVLDSIGPSSPYQPSHDLHLIELGGANIVRLAGTSSMQFKLLQAYRLHSDESQRTGWLVETQAYMYSFIDQSGREVISYHLHTSETENQSPDFPHLHIGPAITGTGLQFGDQYVHRMHVPTGVVPLAAIIRLAIEEFGIRPLRDDWRQVLTQHASI